MNLLEVDSIYLPIPVNFIFIGFDGKGGHGNYLNAIMLLSLSVCSYQELTVSMYAQSLSWPLKNWTAGLQK
jgi:hypothetical protein